MCGGKKRCPNSDVFGNRNFPRTHEVSLFSGLFLLLTLFIHCFPNQSREVFQEVKGRFKTSGLILGSRASELKDC